MAISVAVVCEGLADRRTGCDLADRVFCLEVDWIEPAVLDDYRRWRGLDAQDAFLAWRDVKREAKARNIKMPHGRFSGEKGLPDAQATRRVLRLLQSLAELPQAVILLRDDDRQSQRRAGMQQAIDEATLKLPTVIGLAHAMRECWVLAGFEPQDAAESQRLSNLKRELNFDPRTAAERLTGKTPQDPRSAKRVLSVLTQGNWDREANCWRETDLAVLKSRGANTGLSDYLDELRIVLVAILKPGPTV